MKRLWGLTVRLSIALIVAVLAGWVLQPPLPFPYAFEVSMASSIRGRVQVYYDLGSGFREDLSTWKPLVPSTNVGLIRLPLPSGVYRALRFDPIDGSGTATFRSARIVGPDGRTVRLFSDEEFAPNDQVSELQRSNGLTLKTKDGANDPYFIVTFAQPLALKYDFSKKLGIAWPRLVAWLIGTFGAIVLAENAWRRMISRLGGFTSQLAKYPRLSLGVAALCFSVIGSYPVVFAGRSFVSPNNGIVLLYNRVPTLPGYSEQWQADVKGADIGAMMWQHLPYTSIEGQAARRWTLPLWNRYNSSGITLLGQGQSMLGDPLQFLVAAVGGNAWAFDIKFILSKAFFAYGIGLCVWMLTSDVVAALIATLGAAFIAYFNYRLNHPAIFTMSYAPWILVSWFYAPNAIEKSRARAMLIWFAANWMVLVSGTVKEAYVFLLFLNLTGAALLVAGRSNLEVKRRVLTAFGFTAMAFVLASAPLWWTFYDALAVSFTKYNVPEVWQAPRAWLLGLFDDLFYRELSTEHHIFLPASNFLVLIGCLWAIVQPLRLFASRQASLFLVGGLGCIAIAFKIVPEGWIIKIPFLRNIFHVNNVFSALAVIHFCILAGWGFASARANDDDRSWKKRWVAALGVLGIFLAIYFADIPSIWTGNNGFGGWRSLFHAHVLFYIFLGLLLSASFILVLTTARSMRRRQLTGSTAFLICLCLIAILGRHGLHTLPGLADDYLTKLGMRADLFAPSPAINFILGQQKKEPTRSVGTENTLFPGFASVYGLEGINGPDAIMNDNYRELADAAGMIAPHDWRFLLHGSAVTEWRPMLDFLNTKFVVTENKLSDNSGLRLVASLDLDVYQSDTVWPRAFFTDTVVPYGTAKDFIDLVKKSPAGQPFAAVQEHEKEIFARELIKPDGSHVVPARDYKLTANATSFWVSTPSAGIIVLSETWLAGDFRATVNGQDTPYFRVNHAFKGVRVDKAGDYEIVFSYWPRHFTLSLWLSFTGFCLLIAALVFNNRGRPLLRPII